MCCCRSCRSCRTTVGAVGAVHDSDHTWCLSGITVGLSELLSDCRALSDSCRKLLSACRTGAPPTKTRAEAWRRNYTRCEGTERRAKEVSHCAREGAHVRMGTRSHTMHMPGCALKGVLHPSSIPRAGTKPGQCGRPLSWPIALVMAHTDTRASS